MTPSLYREVFFFTLQFWAVSKSGCILAVVEPLPTRKLAGNYYTETSNPKRGINAYA